jgi:hypothetical protein
LQSQHVCLEVDALVLLEFCDDVVDQALVEILSAEEGVAVGRHHLELMLALDLCDINNGNIKGAASEVIDRYLAVAFTLVQAEGDRRCRGLVDDALDF